MDTDRIARASLPAPSAGAGRSPEQTFAPDVAMRFPHHKEMETHAT